MVIDFYSVWNMAMWMAAAVFMICSIIFQTAAGGISLTEIIIRWAADVVAIALQR